MVSSELGEDMPSLASQAVEAALGAAAVCCCSVAFLQIRGSLGAFWALASILAKAASPALPWTGIQGSVASVFRE